MCQHFSEEEILLFNLLKGELTAQAMAEHHQLTALFGRVIAGNQFTKQQYFELATQLIDHIRFEERELFPHLETILSRETLECVQDILLKIHVVPFEDNYPDEFWVKDKGNKE